MPTAVNPETGERLEYNETTGQWGPPRSPMQDPNLTAGEGPLVRGPVANLLNTMTGGQPGPLQALPVEAGSQGEAFGRGASRGLFTQAVEPAAALYQSGLTQAGAFPPIPGTEDLSLGDRFTVTLNAMRRRRRAEEEAFGGTTLAGEITGSLLPAFAVGASGPVRAAMRTAPVKTGALLGMGTGGVYGAGEAESLGDVPQTSAIGAGLGLLTGAGTAFVADRVASPAFRTAKDKASTILSRYMRDIFPDERAAQAAARSVGPEGTLLDISRGTQQFGQTVSAKSPRFGQRVATDLIDRSRGAAERVSQTLNKVLGTRGKTIKGTLEGTVKQQANKASTLYEKAFLESVPDDKVGNVVARIDDMSASFEGVPGISTALRQLKKSLFKTVNGEKVLKTNVKELHHARKGFADKVFDMRKSSPSLAIELRENVLPVLDDIFPDDYKMAKSMWTGKKSFEDAIAAGRKVLRTDVDVVADDLARMSQADKQGYLIGAARAIDDVVNLPQSGGKVTAQLNKPLIAERLKPLFPDDESFKVFMDRVGFENTYNLTKNAILSGSATQERQAAQRLFAERSADLGTDIRSGAMRRGIEWLMGRKGEAGVPDKLADDLADMLLDQGKVTPDFINELMKTPLKEQAESFINAAIGPTTIAVTAAEQ